MTTFTERFEKLNHKYKNVMNELSLKEGEIKRLKVVISVQEKSLERMKLEYRDVVDEK